MDDQKASKAQELPPSFRRFCAANDISEEIYRSSHTLPRYIRFRTPPSADIIAAVSEQLGVRLEPVRWLPGFFTLPQEVKIAGSEAYKRGQIFGIDASSGAAVEALGVQPGDSVLDLCAAPGAKLCLIAEQVAPNGTATGVDVSRPRLAATRTLLRKYGAAHNCRLFLADGTTFDGRPPTWHDDGGRTQEVNQILGTGFGSKGKCESNGGVGERVSGRGDESQCETATETATETAKETDSRRADTEVTAGFRSDGCAKTEAALGAGLGDASCVRIVGGGAERADRIQEGIGGGILESCSFSSGETKRSEVADVEARQADKLDAETLGEFLRRARGSDVTHSRYVTSSESRAEGTWDGASGLEEIAVSANGHMLQNGLNRTGLVGGLDANDGLRGGSSQRGGRKRREKRGGGDGAPQLFFFGRGICPPELEQEGGSTETKLYDKVLVDAECTHDGSLKHIQKYDWWGWDTFERRVMDPQRLAALTDLQGRLLSNGFQLLRPGGTLVYSTCSFTKAQNEGVVSAFLDAHPDADLVVIPQAATWPCSPGGLSHTLRFTPDVSRTGGLFIAKLVKRLG